MNISKDLRERLGLDSEEGSTQDLLDALEDGACLAKTTITVDEAECYHEYLSNLLK